MLAYKDSCLCCISCILEGKFSKEFQMRSLAPKPCTAPQLQANSPPLKNVIYTLGVKSISKLCFSRCMRSIKKRVSYGAWEAQIRSLQHLHSKTTIVFWAFIPQRGVRNGKLCFSCCMRSTKKVCVLRSMRSLILTFTTPLD